MDIYQQAKEMPYADYYDFHSGYVYHIAEYTKAIKTDPDARIRVSMDGKTIGYANKNND